jgi:hypothetical protein
MTVSYEDVEQFLREEVASLTGTPLETVTSATVLVGANRVIDSADLVMLLLAAEDFAQDRMGAKFDWTSDSAMSEARSTLRSIETLGRHLFSLQGT